MRVSPSIARALIAGALLAACGGLPPRDIPITTTRYDAVASEDAAEFQAARDALVHGDARLALPRLERLSRSRPENILIGTWWQEAEFALARPAEADTNSVDRTGTLEAVRTRFRDLAREEPSVATFVLAARIEPDSTDARTWLDRAEALDPDCAWIHYGRAYLAVRESDWAQARLRIARALAADPGHLWTHRLEAWMEEHDGRPGAAALILQGWLDRARTDPRIDPRAIADAELDLTVLALYDDDPSRARKVLEKVAPADASAWREASVRACLAQADGKIDEALIDARAAHDAAPNELLPAVQIALLLQDHVHDVPAAIKAWEEALRIARTSSDLSAALESTRARVQLERLHAQESDSSAKAP